MDTVHYYRDATGEWRWRRVSENGKTVSDSGEGYLKKSSAEEQAVEQFGDEVQYVTDSGETAED